VPTEVKQTKRRWRFFDCCQGRNKQENAQLILQELKEKGFQTKIWAPLPQHKTSGHIHIVVLSDLRDLLELSGVVDCVYSQTCAKYPVKCPADFKHGNRTKDYSCLKCIGEPGASV